MSHSLGILGDKLCQFRHAVSTSIHLIRSSTTCLVADEEFPLLPILMYPSPKADGNSVL